MSKNNFESWLEAIEEIRDKGILVVKNGLEYKIYLTSNKKPQYKKQTSKLFTDLRKKFEITGVNLLEIKIADQKEINKIITEDGSQEKGYTQIYQTQVETGYTLKLTAQQFKSLGTFLTLNKISIGGIFYFRRFGKRLNTYFKFFTKSQIKTQKVITKNGKIT